MNFNIDKCRILQMSNCQHKRVVFTYSMLGSPLNNTIYFSVQLHHKLSWHPHVNYICNKTNRLLGFLQRNLQFCPKSLREKSYKQFYSTYMRLLLNHMGPSPPMLNPPVWNAIYSYSTELHDLSLAIPGGEIIITVLP